MENGCDCAGIYRIYIWQRATMWILYALTTAHIILWVIAWHHMMVDRHGECTTRYLHAEQSANREWIYSVCVRIYFRLIFIGGSTDVCTRICTLVRLRSEIFKFYARNAWPTARTKKKGDERWSAAQCGLGSPIAQTHSNVSIILPEKSITKYYDCDCLNVVSLPSAICIQPIQTKLSTQSTGKCKYRLWNWPAAIAYDVAYSFVRFIVFFFCYIIWLSARSHCQSNHHHICSSGPVVL